MHGEESWLISQGQNNTETSIIGLTTDPYLLVFDVAFRAYFSQTRYMPEKSLYILVKIFVFKNYGHVILLAYDCISTKILHHETLFLILIVLRY